MCFVNGDGLMGIISDSVKVTKEICQEKHFWKIGEVGRVNMAKVKKYTVFIKTNIVTSRES